MISSIASSINIRAEEEKIYIEKFIKIEIKHLAPEFLEYHEKFGIKCNTNNNECFLCNKKFKRGDILGLACTDKGTLVLCSTCVLDIIEKHGLQKEYKQVFKYNGHSAGENIF